MWRDIAIVLLVSSRGAFRQHVIGLVLMWPETRWGGGTSNMYKYKLQRIHRHHGSPIHSSYFQIIEIYRKNGER